jgi:ferredoxin
MKSKNVPSLAENEVNCCGCGLCSFFCPVKAISLKKNQEGFIYPRIDEEKCIGCQHCMNVCAFKKEKEKVEINNTEI